MALDKGSLTFSFWAVEHGSTERVESVIVIGLPEALGAGNDYSCAITISGFHSLSTRVIGATPFQALDLAMALIKIEMNAHADLWAFFFDEDGPVSFAS
ncbi:MAG: hypothetical protein K9G59_09220 [Caulobacter sp.]|nr:hypothetical protein [Caulobacter sp.]